MKQFESEMERLKVLAEGLHSRGLRAARGDTAVQDDAERARLYHSLRDESYAFLKRYPCCHFYWDSLARFALDVEGEDSGLEVWGRAIEAAPRCLQVWEFYLLYVEERAGILEPRGPPGGPARKDGGGGAAGPPVPAPGIPASGAVSVSDAVSLYEAALVEHVGLHWFSDALWRRYLELAGRGDAAGGPEEPPEAPRMRAAVHLICRPSVVPLRGYSELASAALAVLREGRAREVYAESQGARNSGASAEGPGPLADELCALCGLAPGADFAALLSKLDEVVATNVREYGASYPKISPVAKRVFFHVAPIKASHLEAWRGALRGVLHSQYNQHESCAESASAETGEASPLIVTQRQRLDLCEYMLVACAGHAEFWRGAADVAAALGPAEALELYRRGEATMAILPGGAGPALDLAVERLTYQCSLVREWRPRSHLAPPEVETDARAVLLSLEAEYAGALEKNPGHVPLIISYARYLRRCGRAADARRGLGRVLAAAGPVGSVAAGGNTAAGAGQCTTADAKAASAAAPGDGARQLALRALAIERARCIFDGFYEEDAGKGDGPAEAAGVAGAPARAEGLPPLSRFTKLNDLLGYCLKQAEAYRCPAILAELLEFLKDRAAGLEALASLGEDVAERSEIVFSVYLRCMKAILGPLGGHARGGRRAALILRRELAWLGRRAGERAASCEAELGRVARSVLPPLPAEARPPPEKAKAPQPLRSAPPAQKQ